MQVVPVSVGLASRGWDEQHLDMAAATGQIRKAATSGFTAAVTGTASRFTAGWGGFTETLGNDCEARADGLRTAIRDYVTSDEAQSMQLLVLSSYLQEVR